MGRETEGEGRGRERELYSLTDSARPQKEFDNILAARHVVPRLNELESLIADASSRRASSSRNDPQPTP